MATTVDDYGNVIDDGTGDGTGSIDSGSSSGSSDSGSGNNTDTSIDYGYSTTINGTTYTQDKDGNWTAKNANGDTISVPASTMAGLLKPSDSSFSGLAKKLFTNSDGTLNLSAIGLSLIHI